MNALPGYAGKIARVDLSTGNISHIDTEKYARSLVGGRGIAARIYWEEVPPEIRAFDPENRLIFATGPCAGFDGLAGARWVACGKSPDTFPEFFSHCSLGGSWGVTLKAAGFDGMIVQGRASKPVYIMVEDGSIEIRDASGLWGKGARQAREILKSRYGDSLKILTAGPAGDNMVSMTILLGDNDASGSGGLGAVMGSKKLKAIAVRGSGTVQAAHPQQLQELLARIAELKKDAPKFDSSSVEGLEKEPCTGCTDECGRGVVKTSDGNKGKTMCQSSSFYKEWAKEFYGTVNEVPLFATQRCNDYGLNTKAIDAGIIWLNRCYREGILTEQGTGLPLSKIGSLEFIEALTENIAYRRGFGDILALGFPRAAQSVGIKAVELLYDDFTKAGDKATYPPKAYLTPGILYAMERRQPIQQVHEVCRLLRPWVHWAAGRPGAHLSSAVFRDIAERFWGSKIAGDFSTYEGKELAAKMIQDRQLSKECLVLCDKQWPIMYVEHSPDHVGDPSLESQIFSAITGRETTEQELYRIGERLQNLQRAIYAREGHRGREADTLPDAWYTVPLSKEKRNPDCIFPGKDGEIFSRKGATFDKEQFQNMLGPYYELRGWDRESGLQKRAKLEDLGLNDVADDLAARGLLG